MKPLVSVQNLRQVFNPGTKQAVEALKGISFDIYEGETFGLVGESGSGKSTLGRCLMGLYQASSGQVRFDDQPLLGKGGLQSDKGFKQACQMIFQDPSASLNPRLKVKDIVAEGIDYFGLAKDVADRNQQVADLLALVGLLPDHMNRYPHEFSGGQRQRIGIARALAVKPQFIIADEAISALDVSIQAQVVNLLKDLQIQRKLTYLFIAHDLSMVRYISDRIGVMCQGQLLEVGTAQQIYERPLHDYTKSLLSAIPRPDPDYEHRRRLIPYTHQVLVDAELIEIEPGHFVYTTQGQISTYKDRLKTY